MRRDLKEHQRRKQSGNSTPLEQGAPCILEPITIFRYPRFMGTKRTLLTVYIPFPRGINKRDLKY